MKLTLPPILFAAVVALGSAQANQSPTPTQVLAEDGRFQTLSAALGAAGLSETVDSLEGLTLFAPTDEAFARLPEGTISNLLLPENVDQLTSILTYHALAQTVRSTEVSPLASSPTVAGGNLEFIIEDAQLFVNNAQVVEADLNASNGVIHVIDRVLLPPATASESMVNVLAADPRFSTLVAAAEAAGFFDPGAPETFPILPATENPSTGAYALLAPTNEAFAKLPEGTVESLLLPENNDRLRQILSYHFLPFTAASSTLARLSQTPSVEGEMINVVPTPEGFRLNQAGVEEADLRVSQGTVHVIDTVLLPPTDPETRSLPEVLAADGRFSTLLSAVTDTNLLADLPDGNGLTLLAPTDEAFALLESERPGLIASLAADGTLANVLLYHLIGIEAPSSAVVTLKAATSLSGEAIDIVQSSDRLFVSGSRVIDTDIMASGNVVVHAIDRVMLPPQTTSDQLITDIASANGSFQTLLAALDAAELVSTLESEGPFTVLAPVDAAFSNLPVDFLVQPENRELLTSILTYHVIPQNASSAVFSQVSDLTTVQGEPLSPIHTNGEVTVNGANLLLTDIQAANGTIHVIDQVLLPPSVLDSLKVLGVAENDGRFTTLLAAITAAGLEDTLKSEGPFTIIAPTDEAFAKLPEGTLENLLLPENQATLRGILLHHVIEGEQNRHDLLSSKRVEPLSCNPLGIYVSDIDHSIFIDGAQVVATDVNASNGLIHVVDTVLLPTAEPTQNLVEIATTDPNFSTLATALTLTGLVPTIEASPALTVFAPTNAAFEALPVGVLDTLLAPENVDLLRDVLLYHVMDSDVRSATLLRQPQVPTLAGQRLNLFPEPEGLRVNQSSVATPDIRATNGTIHVINSVLRPTLEPEIRHLGEVLADDGRFNTLLAAVDAAGLSETVVTSPALTILAPTDDAFAQLPEGQVANLLLPENQQALADLLLFHVVPGSNESSTVLANASLESVAGPTISVLQEGVDVFLQGARLEQADLPASNGIIHVIDTVITPVANRSEQTLPEIATSAGSFSTLLAAVEAAGLSDLLSGEGPFTILAPTDDAFSALGGDTLEFLLQPENVGQLRDILLYHVFTTEIGGSTFARLTHPFTASGAGVGVQSSETGLTFNGAHAIGDPIHGANGVIHVIDTVLVPTTPIFELQTSQSKKGQVGLQWLSNRVGPFTVQGSTDLVNWEDLLTTDDKEASLLIDGSQRFFRITR